ncbi:MAG: PaaI family thioesterase [Blastocatellia bacterium]
MEMPSFADSPYQRFLGLTLVRAEDGLVEIRLPFREEFLRTDGSDWLHGGIISALIDIAGDYAIVTKTGAGVPTIDLRVDYLRPARRGALFAIARTVRVGRTIGVADVEVRDESRELVAVGRGVYACPKP